MVKTEKARNLDFYILNIKLRKHSSQKDLTPADYIRVMNALYKKRIHAESSHNKHCIIKTLFTEKNDKGVIEYMSGTMAQFTYIENNNWINLNTLDLDAEFRLPEGLFPDAVITEFVFIPAAHRFCYRKASDISISPYPVKNFLGHAFDQVTDVTEYTQVDVETDKSTVKKILDSYVKRLEIDINYSNLDIGTDYEKFIEKDTRAADAKRLQIIATHKPETSLNVKDSVILSGALEASVSNGEATATVVDKAGKTKTIKTTKHPRKESVKGTMSRFNQLVYEKIMKMFRSDDKPNA